MKKYKVLVDGFELDGTVRTAGDIVEMTEEAAVPAIEAGQIELVSESSSE